MVSTFRINCLNYRANAKAHFFQGENSCSQHFLLLHAVPQSTEQTTGIQTPAPQQTGWICPSNVVTAGHKKQVWRLHSKPEKSRQPLRCPLLPTSGDGTVVPGFSWIAGHPLHKRYHRLILKPTEVKESIFSALSGSCPVLGCVPSNTTELVSWAEQGIAAWRWGH